MKRCLINYIRELVITSGELRYCLLETWNDTKHSRAHIFDVCILLVSLKPILSQIKAHTIAVKPHNWLSSSSPA